MDYKLDSNIPIPERTEFDVEDILPEEAPSRWVPYKPHQRKCANDKHRPEIGKCDLCGDIFPCPSGICGHVDCGSDVPDWVREAEINGQRQTDTGPAL